MAASLGVIYAVSWLIPKVVFPPVAFADILRDATPGDIATGFIEGLKHTAKNLLALAVNLMSVGAGGFAGMLVLREQSPVKRSRLALWAAAALISLASLLAVSSPQGFSFIGLFTYIAAGYVFARMTSNLPLSTAFEPAITGDETPLDAIQRSRRRFIVRVAAAVGGLVVGGTLMLKLMMNKTHVAVAIAKPIDKFIPPADDPDFPEVAGLSPEVTPTDSFYNVDINIIKPAVDHETWKLKIHGLVDKPYELTYKTLQSDFEIVEMAHTLSCISNEVGGDLISTAVWRGVRLKDVLERGGLEDGVVDVVFRAAEGYSDSIPLAKAMEETTLVVFGMNGIPLPREHGFPARIIVPGIYGMKNVKWLTEIEAYAEDYKGYWMVRGWSDIARVKTESRIDVPFDTETVKIGQKPGVLAGVAWAGDRGVTKVEVSADDGRTWTDAVLKREFAPFAWRLWIADLPKKTGRQRVMVRAVDKLGAVQTAATSRPHPDGASGYDSVIFDIE